MHLRGDILKSHDYIGGKNHSRSGDGRLREDIINGKFPPGTHITQRNRLIATAFPHAGSGSLSAPQGRAPDRVHSL
jgi:hypothetical protein